MTLIRDLGLIAGMIRSANEPSNTSVFWYDTNVNIQKYFNINTSLWEPVIGTVGAASLNATLGIGNATLGRDVRISNGDGIFFESDNNFLSRFSSTTLTANRVIHLPNKTGTIALLSDISPTPTPRLDQVIASGNQTQGINILFTQNSSSVFVSDGNFGFLRSNPLTENRNWRFPDSDGTIALLSDIPSITNPTFNFVLQNGNSTSGTDIEISDGDAFRFIDGTFFGEFSIGNLTANRTYSLPDKSGTIALISDLATPPTSPLNAVLNAGQNTGSSNIIFADNSLMQSENGGSILNLRNQGEDDNILLSSVQSDTDKEESSFINIRSTAIEINHRTVDGEFLNLIMDRSGISYMSEGVSSYSLNLGIEGENYGSFSVNDEATLSIDLEDAAILKFRASGIDVATIRNSGLNSSMKMNSNLSFEGVDISELSESIDSSNKSVVFWNGVGVGSNQDIEEITSNNSSIENGSYLILINQSTKTLTLLHEFDIASNFKIDTGTQEDFTLNPGMSILLVYDNSINAWRTINSQLEVDLDNLAKLNAANAFTGGINTFNTIRLNGSFYLGASNKFNLTTQGNGFNIHTRGSTNSQQANLTMSAEYDDKLLIVRGPVADNGGGSHTIQDVFIAANDELSYIGNEIWHAGNDGLDSALDAGLLGGFHSSAYPRLSIENIFTALENKFRTVRADTFTLGSTDRAFRVLPEGNGFRFLTSSLANTSQRMQLNFSASVEDTHNILVTAPIVEGGSQETLIAIGKDNFEYRGDQVITATNNYEVVYQSPTGTTTSTLPTDYTDYSYVNIMILVSGQIFPMILSVELLSNSDYPVDFYPFPNASWRIQINRATRVMTIINATMVEVILRY